MPRGKIPELEGLKASWSEMLGPLRVILARYWARARWMLIGIAALVMVSSVSSVAAPYIFSRLIDTLQADNWAQTILWGFVGYAVLLGLATALQSAVSYMSMMSAETLQYVASTSFFSRLLRKRIGFFIEYNPVAIQAAQNRGAGAINQVVQLLAVIIVPGVVQIALALAVLGATINLEIVLVVAAYGAVFIGAIFLSNRYSRPWLEKAIEADQRRAGFLGNAVSAMETLRYFGGDEWVGRRFADAAEETRASWAKWATRRELHRGVWLASPVQLIAFAILLPPPGRRDHHRRPALSAVELNRLLDDWQLDRLAPFGPTAFPAVHLHVAGTGRVRRSRRPDGCGCRHAGVPRCRLWLWRQECRFDAVSLRVGASELPRRRYGLGHDAVQAGAQIARDAGRHDHGRRHRHQRNRAQGLVLGDWRRAAGHHAA